MNNNNSLWRINIHTHEGPNKQIEVFNYCKSLGILGIGWQTKDKISNTNKDIETIAKENNLNTKKWNTESFKKVLKAYYEIKPDDLIWTRSGNIYYLCRVLGPKIDYIKEELNKKEIEEHTLYDIWHGIKCEILEVGTEEKINGDIVSFFNSGTICKKRKNLNTCLNFSKSIYNKLTNTNYYKVKKIKTIKEIWSNIKANQLEEIVLLYLQKEKNYGIYTHTCKVSTKTNECILFSKENGTSAYVQVKEGAINIEDIIYKNIYNNHKFYFFSNEENYGKYQHSNNIIIITKKELEEFMKNNKKIISNLGWPFDL